MGSAKASAVAATPGTLPEGETLLVLGLISMLAAVLAGGVPAELSLSAPRRADDPAFVPLAWRSTLAPDGPQGIRRLTLAAMLGAIPLALGEGDGAELRRPLGLSVLGGLVLSQLLTLYTTPVVFVALERVRQRFARSTAPGSAPLTSASLS